MWEAAGRRIREWGGEIRMGRRVVALARSGDGWEAVSRHEEEAGAEGDELRHRADFVISSAPIRDLMAQIEPPPPLVVARAAQGLRYWRRIYISWLGSIYVKFWYSCVASLPGRTRLIQNYCQIGLRLLAKNMLKTC